MPVKIAIPTDATAGTMIATIPAAIVAIDPR
jgi:hypothetical protein